MQKHRVRYMLIGGIAVNFHGYIRNIQDMDVVNYDFLRSMKILAHRNKDWLDVSELDELKKKDKK